MHHAVRRRLPESTLKALLKAGADTGLSKLTEAYTYDQLAQTPQLTIKSFEQVSVLLSRQIFSDLKQ